jgi:hypothetical protein
MVCTYLAAPRTSSGLESESSARAWPAVSEPRRHQILHVLWQRQESQRVGNRRAILADALGDALVRVLQVLDQRLIAERFIDGIEILALQVLDQCGFEHLLVGQIAHHDGNMREAGALRSEEPTLAGDQFVMIANLPHQKGLQDALRADGSLELGQGALVDVVPRLPRIGANRGHRKLGDRNADRGCCRLGRQRRRRGRRRRAHGRNERLETSTQNPLRHATTLPCSSNSRASAR